MWCAGTRNTDTLFFAHRHTSLWHGSQTVGVKGQATVAWCQYSCPQFAHTTLLHSFHCKRVRTVVLGRTRGHARSASVRCCARANTHHTNIHASYRLVQVLRFRFRFRYMASYARARGEGQAPTRRCARSCRQWRLEMRCHHACLMPKLDLRFSSHASSASVPVDDDLTELREGDRLVLLQGRSGEIKAIRGDYVKVIDWLYCDHQCSINGHHEPSRDIRAINGNQGPSRAIKAINGHQGPSRAIKAINGHQGPSRAIKLIQRGRVPTCRSAINGHQWPSMVINGHQWPSMAINGHQRQSIAIRVPTCRSAM